MSTIRTGLVEATVHGRYLVRAGEGEGPSPLLVAFHGYGENAERCLSAVVEIPGLAAWTVLAVQALHPFYNRSGEVVASWMTKLDRETAIAENVRYVGDVIGKVRHETGDGRPLVYLGFSQGTAMAYRAAAGAGQRCQGLIALGGDVPPEVAGRRQDGFPAVLIGRGTKDEWYTAAKVEHDVAVLEAIGAEVETCVFDGGHEWVADFRRRCAEFLAGFTRR